MKLFTFASILLCLTTSAFCVSAADVPVPIATDSRIKTFVYSENDVFNLVTHYGYQSNIEFGPLEEIETISVGDRVGWQIVPGGRRLFIRAMTANARTNMTVVTNRHAYQFDLASVPAPQTRNEELVYVVRFFYPDDKKNAAAVAPVPYSDDVRTPLPVAVPAAGVQSANNYRYTFTGSDALAPLKVFDDGTSTYFKFRSSTTAPTIAMLTGNHEVPLTPHRSGEYWVVDTVSARLTLRQGSALVCVYNEKLLPNAQK